MSNRREKLIASVIGPEMDETKAKILDGTLKLILSDMGQHYCKMWEVEGPGIMVFQPKNKERSMFFMTLKELHSAQEECEHENNGDLAETFRRILEAAQKINPLEKAGYLINDRDGMRYLEIDYNKVDEKK
jgi:hypothetical protein